jgi:hypothetical protein
VPTRIIEPVGELDSLRAQLQAVAPFVRCGRTLRCEHLPERRLTGQLPGRSCRWRSSVNFFSNLEQIHHLIGVSWPRWPNVAVKQVYDRAAQTA